MTFDHPLMYPVYEAPDPDTWKHLDWAVSAGGYRLVIEHGAMVGLVSEIPVSAAGTSAPWHPGAPPDPAALLMLAQPAPCFYCGGDTGDGRDHGRLYEHGPVECLPGSDYSYRITAVSPDGSLCEDLTDIRVSRLPGATSVPDVPYRYFGMTDQRTWRRCECPWWHRLPFVGRFVHSELP